MTLLTSRNLDHSDLQKIAKSFLTSQVYSVLCFKNLLTYCCSVPIYIMTKSYYQTINYIPCTITYILILVTKKSRKNRPSLEEKNPTLNRKTGSPPTLGIILDIKRMLGCNIQTSNLMYREVGSRPMLLGILKRCLLQEKYYRTGLYC